MTVLVADIGGTNARFALVEEGSTELSNIASLATTYYPSLEQAVDGYLAGLDSAPVGITAACFALACPVHTLPVQMTNLNWVIDPDRLASSLGLAVDRVSLINDFTAQAMAMVNLPDTDFEQLVAGNVGHQEQAQLVVGPGTGLGVAGLVPSLDRPDGHDRSDKRWQVLASEGGHISYAIQKESDLPVLAWFQKQHGRVSVERLLCGDGLLSLYRYECHRNGLEPSCVSAAQVSMSAMHALIPSTKDNDYLAKLAVDRFYRVLGSTIGDLALAMGTWGGIHLCGGILPKIVGKIDHQPMLDAMINKGRFSDSVANIPVRLCRAENPGLVGAAAWLL